jgi:hypothetical protein
MAPTPSSSAQPPTDQENSTSLLESQGPKIVHMNSQEVLLLREILARLPKPNLFDYCLESLRTIQSQTARSWIDFILGGLVQILAFLAVIIFGAFQCLAYKTSQIANKQTSDANQLAFISLCLDNSSVSMP